MRQLTVVGNWKMNGSSVQANKLVSDILNGLNTLPKYADTIIICPPALYIPQVSDLTKNTLLKVGVQNVNAHQQGAYTGEISTAMLSDFNTPYVVIGHSERRALYAETNQDTIDKVRCVIDAGMTPILCVGETLDERQGGKMESVVGEQVRCVIEALGIESFSQIIIAYEPVWAIGTGVTATPEQAQDTHHFIRGLLSDYSTPISETISILYGGSVNKDNASDLFACADIDGGLIGGASLKADDFLTICKG